MDPKVFIDWLYYKTCRFVFSYGDFRMVFSTVNAIFRKILLEIKAIMAVFS